MNKLDIKNLVLSGGGVKGISQLGALQYLIDNKHLDLKNLTSIAASSVGSIIGLLIIIGFSVSEIWQFILRLDLGKIFGCNLLLMMDSYGMDTGDNLMGLLKKIIYEKTYHKKITFQEVKKKFGISFTVTGTCLDDKQICYFNEINTPEMDVLQAVRISISLPIILTPVTYQNKKYIDGGILDNFPMHLFNDEHTMGINICGNYDTRFTNIEEYLFSIFNIIMWKQYEADKKHHHVINIEYGDFDVSMTKMNVNYETKIKLYQTGVFCAEIFFKNN